MHAKQKGCIIVEQFKNEIMKKEDLVKLNDYQFHESIGIFPKWKVQSVSRTGYATLIAYYDANQCRSILDAACGIDGWENEYLDLSGKIYCNIMLDIENNRVSKSNCGGPKDPHGKVGDAEKIAFRNKAEASDAFKRASAAWGIGRHLASLDTVIMKQGADKQLEHKGHKFSPYANEQISAYCNSISSAEHHLYTIYNLCKSRFDGNEKAFKMLEDMKEFIQTK